VKPVQKNNEPGSKTSCKHSPQDMLSHNSFIIMGILNVTPDSFYDGGRYTTIEKALSQGQKLMDEGADIIDIGAESSRPGSQFVTVDEEMKRLLPVIEKIRSISKIPISVDTTKSAVAKAALDAGADWINDISAGKFDPEMREIAAEYQCPVILMHSRGTPETMQKNPWYKDASAEVHSELLASADLFINAGVLCNNIILDPGIGFGKRFEDNIAILHHIKDIVDTGYTVCIGTSRKSFIGSITEKETSDRLYGSLGSIASAYINGVKIFRVHDAGVTRDFLSVLSVIERYE